MKEELKRTTQEALDLGVWLTAVFHAPLSVFSIAGIWGPIHSGPYWGQEGRVLWERPHGTRSSPTGREVGGATCGTQGSSVTTLITLINVNNIINNNILKYGHTV